MVVFQLCRNTVFFQCFPPYFAPPSTVHAYFADLAGALFSVFSILVVGLRELFWVSGWKGNDTHTPSILPAGLDRVASHFFLLWESKPAGQFFSTASPKCYYGKSATPSL